MRDDRERCQDIQEAIAHIERHAAKGRSTFDTDELVQSWMVRHLQIIGEAARGVSATFRVQNPQVPWSQIVGMRHILVHNYFQIDLDIVWSVIEKDLPDLKSKIDDILNHP